MSKTCKAARIADKQPGMCLVWPGLAKPHDLSAEEAHIWVIPIDADVAPRAESLECLSEDERRRAEQFQFEAPRRRFLAARLALRRLLGEYLEMPAANVSLAYSRFGKPLLGEPHGDLLRFNLAHTSNLV